ncbi:DNA repair ATPase [Flammeovirga aprica]|uniref:AAA family ATPase n=1 Tax=Flammeovirga aprica JL-4 TaxID=694437 RepID=A0A7X9S0K9_9BACT|nr:DNA repair ATPase [Flammeovirga aprica]NME72198.1 AAA family ATPase [Flammeovirga aprica JL-4]
MLENGTYELLQQRLQNSGKELHKSLEQLNNLRKEIFGSIEIGLIASERLMTENNCIARDMMPIGETFLFGYNVQLGLRQEMALSDVFGIYSYDNESHTFKNESLSLIEDKQFIKDFNELYQYQKDTKFTQFFKAGKNLYMLFQLSDRVGDIKAFKWEISGGALKYADARSDHEVVFPPQHDFEWKRTTRSDFREGEHPHVSILDRVFVETVGGDLTIKIEDNTLDGEGILAEEVDEKEQRLEDGEIHYADLGNIILLKVLPYREKEWRYFVFNDKLKTAIRVNAISNACILLPEEQGIVFSNGYYLQNGESKLFEQEDHDWVFKKKIVAPNGEDYLFVFYQRDTGEYILLSYNVIEQTVQPPLKCNGYSVFPNGELVYFKADEEPRKVHNLQILQSPFVDADLVEPTTENDHYLVNLGNKEVVKAMAQLNGINVLCQKSDNYMGLYSDILQEASAVTDMYPWLGREDVGNILEPVDEIKDTATAAIEEYEKVSRQRKNAEEQQKAFDEECLKITRQIDRGIYKDIRDYVQGLASLRALRGKAVSLKEVRYIQIPPIEEKEEKLKEHSLKLGERCIQFLLGDNALAGFTSKIDELRTQLPEWEKTIDVEEAIDELTALGKELELLIETVSNLKIKDATQTAEIINNISQLFSSLNNVQAQAREKKNQLGKQEAEAEFTAQYRLLEQSVSSFLDISTTPEECDEYLSKLSAQVEELEGKFADFDDFAEQLEKKREEVATVFETKKIQLEEVRNKRVLRLRNSADRMIQSILAKAKKMEKEDQLIAYFSTDLLIEKLRETAQSLIDFGETSKGEEVLGALKKAQKEAIRQLRDRNELNVDGPGFIRFGKHSFAVAQQELGATIIERKGNLFYHLTGTDFFEQVQDESLLSTKEVWTMSLPSESSAVYRGEYLAYQFLATKSATAIVEQEDEALLKEIQQYMGTSLNDGYLKGVHDLDALKVVKVYALMNTSLKTLCYDSVTRALAQIVWLKEIPKKEKEIIQEWASGFSLFSSLFEEKADPSSILKYITPHVEVMLKKLNLEVETAIEEISYCLMDLLTYGYFEISEKAYFLAEEFKRLLLAQNVKDAFDQHISKLSGQWEKLLTFMEIGWSTLFKSASFTEKEEDYVSYTLEASLLLLETFKADRALSKVEYEQELEGLLGDHSLINEGKYQFNFYDFLARIKKHIHNSLPLFEQYTAQKREVLDAFKREVKLSSFEPKVLSSFVRNRLINDVYLPLIGENLSKQIGAAGSKKRTDLMGLLLLISPPGYGKTTLMEYVANRLGLIFMKINGPSIGHQVLSLDPEEAPNATAREELEKLGLALEMGNNIMLYLDDIQHCNPEFLQKFISLCDGQRKIEGVYKGNTKTYDLRGKRFCVIMAGNPYTESGDKFQIPDMLANRADTYNLGEVIGSTQTAFELSYIENCLTSNQFISQWTNYPKKDLYALVSAIKNDDLQNLELEVSISTDEKEESTKIFRQLLYVQSVILKVNQAYVASAAQDDDYRVEPPFKLQGSYRNMNKLAEKLSPLMNEKELQELVVSHYENESQTLTSAAEENLLKFKELIEILTESDLERWNEIKQTFRQKNSLKVLGDQSAEKTLDHLSDITSAIKELKKEVIYIVK